MCREPDLYQRRSGVSVARFVVAEGVGDQASREMREMDRRSW